MKSDTPLWKAHDASQLLQDLIEELPNVERAFVHVDHEATHTPVSTCNTLDKVSPAECSRNRNTGRTEGGFHKAMLGYRRVDSKHGIQLHHGHLEGMRS